MADIDPAEYELKGSIRSDKERQRMKVLLEAERKVEDERQKQEAAVEARRLAEAQARLVARPYPVKLTEEQCTRCHEATNYESQRHNRLGWELVTLRMQLMNDAQFGPGERVIIAAYLAETYPATGMGAWIETFMQGLALFVPVGFWLGWRSLQTGLRKRRRAVRL